MKIEIKYLLEKSSAKFNNSLLKIKSYGSISRKQRVF
jgi:hypothetical protein